MRLSVSPTKGTTYRPVAGAAAHHAPAETLQRWLHEALLHLGTTGRRPVLAKRTGLSDAGRGRSWGLVTITRYLVEARAAGCTREAALRVVFVVRRFVDLFFPAKDPGSLREVLRADQRYEGLSNETEVDLLANPSDPAALERFIEAKRLDQQAGEDALAKAQQLHAALTSHT